MFIKFIFLFNNWRKILHNFQPLILPPIKSDEFLPPINNWVRIGGLLLFFLVFISFFIAAITKYKVTVKTPGIVRPTGELRIIQPAIEGTVAKILVQENQAVNRGDKIATIDDQELQNQKSKILVTSQQNQLQLVQIDGQIQALERQIAEETIRIRGSIASAKADMKLTVRNYRDRTVTANSEVEEAESNLKIAQNDLQKAQSELQSVQANFKANQAAFQAAILKRDRYQSIAQSGSISQNQLEEAQLIVDQQEQILKSQSANVDIQKQVIEQKQQALQTAIAKRKKALAILNPSNAVLTIATEKITQERAAGEVSLAKLKQEQKSLIQNQVALKNQISNTEKELKDIENQLQKTVITSPAAGTILKLELRNSGQVVSAGQAIAYISPSTAPLVIKSRINAADISKVKVCQAKKVAECEIGKVKMRVSTYPYPDYGTLSGAVRAISTDSTASQNHGNTTTTAYYEITIEPEKLYLERGKKQYPIQSGMEVTADIIAEEETVLIFMLRKARLLTDL
ncbi:MAG: HlyD family efflux transporter periplasmic adaptor subunit (plasmid) [Dolichospermum sp. DET50]|nr:HlyD family efflux transporter periplasmic adaptor subunit [Dolichospermum sp. DET66]MBS3035925.1 HlyD family efflux transporter periplasmic adaptor subunit [Dolichospermum sp. DET67]MBS3041093.1 HlyD family efflux transporter periplasmic adaptor subunit [Dolichospermum sp. DET50]QSX70976.1 MAG: HlyD family efflux transporter periplasmic adaptor subunit [Dolichospermum sp. DET69]